MNRTKKFFYNSMSTGMYQLILMISGFIVPRVIISNYGSDVNGLVSSITQFISYISLVEAGISGAGVYALYKPLATGNQKEINGIVSAVKKYYYQSGYIFSSLIIVMAVLYPLFIKTDSLTPMAVGFLIIAIGARGFMDFFTLAKYRVLLTADQKTYIVSLSSIVYVVLNTLIIFLFATLKFHVLVIYYLSILAILARSLILHIYVKVKYKNIKYNAPPNKKALDKKWSALFLQILGTIQNGAPTVLATIFTSLESVSIYATYNMVMSGINGILSIFISGLSASFGDIIARKEMKTLQRTTKEFEFAYYSIITVVYGISFSLLLPFIDLYTKNIADINYIYPITAFLIVLNGLLYNIKTPQGMLVISAGLYKETILQTSIQGGIIVVFGAIFGSVWGINGIIIGACLSNIYRTIDLWFFIPKNITKLPIWGTILRQIKVFASVFLTYFISSSLVNITINSYLDWILAAVIYGVIAVVIVIVSALLFDRKNLSGISKRVKSMMIKTK